MIIPVLYHSGNRQDQDVLYHRILHANNANATTRPSRYTLMPVTMCAGESNSTAPSAVLY